MSPTETRRSTWHRTSAVVDEVASDVVKIAFAREAT